MTRNKDGVREGGCACGSLRYRMTGRPLIVHCCHCRDCQRLSGAAFAVNAWTEASNVELLAGETEAVVVPTSSGSGQKVIRCPRCRVAVWSHYLRATEAMSFVRVGTLDEPDSLSPDIHIFTRSKQPWVTTPSDVPSVEDYYDAAAYWTEDSLKRMAAAFGK